MATLTDSIPPPTAASASGDLGFVLTGGGARGAYQVGILSWLARHYPDLRVPIMTGVSAGAVNAAHLAGHHGTFAEAVQELLELWCELDTASVFRVDAPSLGRNGARWALRLASGGNPAAPRVRGLLDTSPLRRLLRESLHAVGDELTGIDYNLRRGTLKACAIVTTSYTTGQTVVWVQGRDIQDWTRPQRRAVLVPALTADHVLASAALPLFFPAVRIGNAWYGDGGIRLAAPLSPALYLGADRILAISTRAARSQQRANRPAIAGYPPPVQVFGVLLNAIFLDLIDQDALRLERINKLLGKLPPEQWEGMRPLSLLTMRPSRDLGALSRRYEFQLPRLFRFLTRGLGTRETTSSDVLSMLLFEEPYLRRLIRLGEQDAEARGEEIAAFVEGGEALRELARA